jgi:uncharacterized membrane protein
VRCVIVSGFCDVAPLATWGKVVVVVSAAVFERDDVLHVPIVRRAYVPPALVATAVVLSKKSRPALRRHAALGVHVWAHGRTR